MMVGIDGGNQVIVLFSNNSIGKLVYLWMKELTRI